MIPCRIANTFLLVGVMLFAANITGSEEPPARDESTIPTLTPEELANYQFERDEDEVPVQVSDLSIGQKFVMDAQRRDVKDLITRRLGILRLKGDLSDLKTLQRIVDMRVLKKDHGRQWQSLGIAFGDILVNNFDLHWVVMEDEFGVSKALQWRDTKNFVFPITLFSKRVEFGQDIDMVAIYNKLSDDIANFERIEKTRGMRR